jgi:hypothetical protein
LESTKAFFNASELALEREKFSLKSAEDNWLDLDDDDDDKITILKIRAFIHANEEIDEEDIDSRILLYEFLKAKFRSTSSSWNRVQLAADILIDNCCDPTKDYLDFARGTQFLHVAPEQ